MPEISGCYDDDFYVAGNPLTSTVATMTSIYVRQSWTHTVATMTSMYVRQPVDLLECYVCMAIYGFSLVATMTSMYVRQSMDIHGRYEGGGVCEQCRDFTDGINCQVNQFMDW